MERERDKGKKHRAVCERETQGFVIRRPGEWWAREGRCGRRQPDGSDSPSLPRRSHRCYYTLNTYPPSLPPPLDPPQPSLHQPSSSRPSPSRLQHLLHTKSVTLPSSTPEPTFSSFTFAFTLLPKFPFTPFVDPTSPPLHQE